MVLMAVLLLALGASVGHALTDGGATRGEADAVFRAALTGGGAIVVHQPVAQGAPLRFFEGSPDGVRIRPFGSFAEYCAPGWHVIMVAWVEDPADWGGKSAALAVLASLDVSFVLDGVPLDAVRSQTTAVKGAPFGIDHPVVGVSLGAFLPPGSVSLGTHILESTTTIGPFTFTDTVSFSFVTC
jgi:hypothetical protein